MSKSELRIEEARKMMFDKLNKTANQVGTFLESESKARTPVDTGHLRRNIMHETNVTREKTTVFVGSNVEYDGFVELGTINQNAQPHHVPAVTENVGTLQSMIKKGMKV